MLRFNKAKPVYSWHEAEKHLIEPFDANDTSNNGLKI